MADEEPRTGELTTANYGWIKPTVGDSDDAWGGYLNSDLDGIDSVVHGIQTSIPTVPAASATAPVMDGTASAGSSAAWSRGDHVHPSDTTKYNTSNPSGYQTAAQVTAALAPYALTTSVPVASSTTPLMDGTAAIGVGTTWARADHAHPTDTSLYPASNPSGYQTAAQVTTSLASYLPLTGGTLSGALHGTAATFSGAGSFGSTIQTTGYQSRQGVSGAYQGNFFNKAYTGSATQLWVDTTNLGNITVSSDYRIKRDVIALPSMWEKAKALRPVSYRHQDYIPPNAPIREGEIEPRPLVVGDDVERWGFVAHELQEALIADAATGVKDQANCIQSPNVMTIVATLTRTLQEAMERIEALEAQRG